MSEGVCVCATTVNLGATYDPSLSIPTLTLDATGTLTLDNVQVEFGMLVLIKDQIDEQSNGLYYCTIEGDIGVQAVLSRAADYITPNNWNQSGIVTVLFGDTQANSGWIVETYIQEPGDIILFRQVIFPFGSEEITKVGTITTGTWDAGPVSTDASLEIPATTEEVSGTILQAGQAFIHSFGNECFFAGQNVGNFTSSGGENNLGIGKLVLISLLGGSYNIGLGKGVLRSVDDGIGNIGIGSDTFPTLPNITNGSYNFAVSGGEQYTSSESSNICIYNTGVTGESNKIRIGTYGTGNTQQNICYLDPTLVTNNGEIKKTVNVTTATYTMLATDYYLYCNRSGAIAITLLASPETGRVIVIKDNSGAALTNNITITPAAGNIDGAANYVITINYASVTLIYNGTRWNVM